MNLYDNLRKGGPDSARSWTIAVGLFLISFLSFGINRSSGVIFTALLDSDDQLTREAASWVFTLPGAALIYGAPMTGFLATYFSSRSVIVAGILINAVGSFVCYFYNNIIFMSVFFGLFRGTGIALATTLTPALVNNNFVRHRSKAMGIATVGSPLGGIVLPTLIQFFLDSYGFKTNFLFIGGISLIALLGALPVKETTKKREDRFSAGDKNYTEVCGNDNKVFERDAESSIQPLIDNKNNVPKQNYNSRPIGIQLSSTCKQDARIMYTVEKETATNEDKLSFDSDRKPTLELVTEVLYSRGLYIISLCGMSSSFLVSTYGQTIVDYAEDKKIERYLGIYLIMANSGAEIVGRLTLGWVTDKKYVSNSTFLAVNLFVTASMTLVMTFVNDYTALTSCGVVIGIGLGASVNVISTSFAWYFSEETMFLSTAFVRAASGIAIIVRAPIVGYFRDGLGSYDHLFQLIAGILYLSSLAWIAEGIFRRHVERKKKYITDVK